MKQYTAPQIADIFNVSRQSVFNYIKAKKMRAKRIGGVWVIDANEVKRWKASQHGAYTRLSKT